MQTENRLLLNYYLMTARRLSKLKVAFWGHVYNMQDDVYSRRNRIKLKTLHYTDWWFAYTKGVKQFLINQGYPANKITAVQNAIDTIRLKKYYVDIKEEEAGALKKELGIVGSNVGIYCGGMYPDKQTDFILESCHRIKNAVPDFHMLFIGSGVEAGKIKAAANQCDWIHYIGRKFGIDRVIYFKIAAIQIMPGLVGLTVLDSMAMETPMVTTEHLYHGPEIEYLENGKTGLITRFDMSEYSAAIIDLLKTQKYLGLAQAGKQA
ncbi:MAG TPA: glycosyltransferase, partial [Mucilaginibacter sp.]|nr:glycosyltransferase [Mucilaginibacter sp.]